VTYGDRIDRSRIVYFGHSQGSMTLPAAYGRLAPSLPFSGVVLFEGMPKDTRFLETALRNMGARHVLLVNGQGGWQGKHAAVAASLAAHGFDAWHAPGSFGHFFNDDALAILQRETPRLFEQDGYKLNTAEAPASKKRLASVTFALPAR
jgi:predicted esterase